MREMIDEMKEAPLEEISENSRLELATLPFKERQKRKREIFKETLSSMTGKEKIGYLLRYYLPITCIVLIAIAVIAGIAVTVYKNSRPVTLSYAIVNVDRVDLLDLSVFDEFAAEQGAKKSDQLLSDVSRTLNPTSFANGSLTYTVQDDYTGFNLICRDGYYDVIITNAAGLNYLGETDMVQLLDEYLPEDLYEQVKDNIVKAKDSYGDWYESGIDISDTNFAKSLNTGYDNIYLTFTGTGSESKERALSFTRFLLSY